MATIKEILQEERNRAPGSIVLFLEGKFWKAYELSAYVLAKQYSFMPSKRFIKLVGEDVISVGFPQEQLPKYLPGAILDESGKQCRGMVAPVPDDMAFREWKSSTRVKEPKPRVVKKVDIPEGWKPQSQLFREENLPVFKLVYGLLLRIFHDARKWGRDYRYTLGEDLKHHLIRMEVCIYHGNAEKEAERRLGYLTEALDRMLEVKLCVRILHDSGQLSLKKYALLCEQMVMIEKHLDDWIKYHKTYQS